MHATVEVKIRRKPSRSRLTSIPPIAPATIEVGMGVTAGGDRESAHRVADVAGGMMRLRRQVRSPGVSASCSIRIAGPIPELRSQPLAQESVDHPNPRVRNQVFRSWPQAYMARFRAENIP
jgi:hypothetical protein